ncbi:MAG: hypothetical protein GY854_16175, partial [Deltaproteobacteria bacterium]|nr:hypothetical protein [Deltaproteobacteria bacterium]
MRRILVVAAIFSIFLSPSAIIAKAQNDQKSDETKDEAGEEKEAKEESATEPSDSSEATPPAGDNEAAPSESETPQDTPGEPTDQPANDESSSAMTSSPSEAEKDQNTSQDKSVVAPPKEEPAVSENTTAQENSLPTDVEGLETTDVSSENPGDYGGMFTLGVALGGGGIVGIPARIFFAELFAFELGAYYRPVIVIDGDSDPAGVMFAGGFDIYFNKRYSDRRIKLNGIFVKGGFGISRIVYSEFAALGWAHERMHVGNERYSFSFELGTGVLFNQLKQDDVDVNDIGFLLYWKFHWGWALGT